MDIQPALQAFAAESRDLLAQMEDALLRLERTPGDAEAVNAVFRAAHTLKGSSGAFGFDAVAQFAHHVEGLLEEIRGGNVAIDGEIIGLLLACADQLAALVAAALAAEGGGQAAAPPAAMALIERLQAFLAPRPSGPLPAPHEPEVEAHGGGPVASDMWHISLRFGPDVLRHGLDPLPFLQYLATLGEIAAVDTLFDAMPDAARMDPESCYMGLEIDFRGDTDKARLESAFEFLREDCTVRILPPHSMLSDYVRLIEELPEDKARIGELLVRSGALTQRELDEGLRLQESFDAALSEAAPERDEARKLGHILVGQGVVQHELVDAALEKQRVIQEQKKLDASFVRVRSDKLDELITLVGELVIAGATTRLLALRTGDSDLIESTATGERLVEEVRDRALSLRMVPIGETFHRFKRVVRDLGKELGKEVELVPSGTDTEVDKSMAEKIVDPIMHLVRNALDHGIDAPQARRARGKPAAGTVFLNAFHDSGSIVIEVGDDGAGFDRARILARATERGMVAPGQQLTDEEILELVMAPGFSTAESVTSVSGRGVGMDVVRRAVEALRGSVSIDSVEGRGTTISMRLPLTLAIIDGFLVGVGRAAYVVPLDMVVECIELDAEDRAAVRTRGYINLRDQVLPVLRLRDVFGVPGEAGRRENIVVVQYAGRLAGFIVDSLLGELQTVIKPLGKLFERLSGISGSTILGNGEVALILDVQALVQRAAGIESARARAAIEFTGEGS